jgi:hypothetical protein
MDPLTILCGAITVCQAGGQLVALLTSIKPYFTAPEDVDALTKQIKHVKSALDGLNSATSSVSSPELRCLRQLADGCIFHISQLESLVTESFMKKQTSSRLGSPYVHRMAWLRKRGRVEGIKQQLKDILLAIQLQVVFLTL